MNDCGPDRLKQTRRQLHARPCGCVDQLLLASPDGYRWILIGLTTLVLCSPLVALDGRQKIPIDMKS